MENRKLTDLEEKFCLVYTCGPSPYNGNARKTYDLVFNGATGMLLIPLRMGLKSIPIMRFRCHWLSENLWCVMIFESA